MNDTIEKAKALSFNKPSFSRYFALRQKASRMSLTRALQYEILSSYNIKGKVLDFGGGDLSRYKDIITCDDYYSINIDPEIQPTWITKVGEIFPCLDMTFDTVLSMNTLEHIFNPLFVLEQFNQVLKPGGELLMSVPFLYPVHGHPDDFCRYTPSWFRTALLNNGFSQVEVIPLSWGPFSTSVICSGLPGPCKAIRKNMALLIDLVYYQMRSKKHSQKVIEESLEKIATAFFIRAIK